MLDRSYVIVGGLQLRVALETAGVRAAVARGALNERPQPSLLDRVDRFEGGRAERSDRLCRGNVGVDANAAEVVSLPLVEGEVLPQTLIPGGRVSRKPRILGGDAGAVRSPLARGGALHARGGERPARACRWLLLGGATHLLGCVLGGVDRPLRRKRR